MIKRVFLRQCKSVLPPATSRSISHLHTPFRSRHTQPLASILAKSLPPRLGARWQSTETDAEARTNPDLGPVPSDGSKAPAAEDASKKELEGKNREIIELKDKYLRSVAEFRNLQERTKRDIDSARNFAIQRFATDLVESIDNLDRALGSVPPEALDPDMTTTSNTSSQDLNNATSDTVVDSEAPNKDLLNLHAGLRMTEEILMNTLKKHGLERFDPQENGGRKFDPRLDEATFMTRVEGRQDGEVFHTQSKGFVLNGRVIRPAKVGVVKNS